MKSILDPTFKYVPAAETDLRKTFARINRERAKAREAEVAKLGALRTVLPFTNKRP